jgi:2,3-bisphosphoglycerate-independent phosphoglycerate mutase
MKGKIIDFASSFFLRKPGLKGVFVVLDGLGDLPHSLLDNKTPLEAAETPNLDFLATRGELGYMDPVKPGFIPESDESLISIFGNDLFASTRGRLEALGSGIDVSRGDVSFRANFATIDSLEERNIVDRRVARTLNSEEAEILAMAVNKVKLPCEFVFKPMLQHRAVLVLKGGFSEDILGNDLAYIKGKIRDVKKVQACRVIEDDENAQYTCNIINEFLEKAHKVLESHPVNEDRRKRGLLPANYILIKGAGIEPPKLRQYKRWAAINYMSLEKGFSKASGMKVFSFDYPLFEDIDAYGNLWEGLREACSFAIKCIKRSLKDYDYIYVHVNEIDFPGHDNKPLEKKMMLEYIDKTLFKFLRSFAPPNKIKVLVTGNHSTPCKIKSHSADPVPVLFYNMSLPKEKHFNEKEARKGSLGRILGKDLLNRVGFVK